MLVNIYKNTMRLTPENKKKITNRIRASAAKAFREQGYDAVSLDRCMRDAQLTRGAFYAHYKSKAELFADVVRHEHPLLNLLKKRAGVEPNDLHKEMLAIFREYMAVSNRQEVFHGCSLAALSGDATRAAEVVKTGFGAAFHSICKEMARGQNVAAQAYAPLLVLASGAVQTASAISESNLQSEILAESWSAFTRLLPDPRKGDYDG